MPVRRAGTHDLIELDGVEQAVAANHSPTHQEAVQALADGAERDLRIIESID